MSQEKKLEFLGGGTTRRQVIAGAATTLGGIVMTSSIARAGAEEEISHTSESTIKNQFSTRTGNTYTKR